jgi:adenine-specific DNA-methyltransferase
MEGIIIKGDNLTVLKSIKSQFERKIKCVYIDPPYNNGESYKYYNDKKQEKWLKEVEQRAVMLHEFLTEDGSFWISINDAEVHYLKVGLDAIFGRNNFVTTIIWNHKLSRENRNIFSRNNEYILVYAKSIKSFKRSRNLLPPTEELINRYKNPDNDPRGLWQSVSLSAQNGHAVDSQYYGLKSPNGRIHYPPKGRVWVHNQERMLQEIENNNIWFGKTGDNVPRKKKFLKDAKIGLTPETLWFGEDVGTTEEAKKELISLFPSMEPFETPKPERLLKRIIEISSNEDDWILDAYAGSGTTCSVAMKYNRNFIGIEIGNHAADIIYERVNKSNKKDFKISFIDMSKDELILK